MKILTTIFFFLAFTCYINAQTKVTAPLTRNSPADTAYGTHTDTLGYGGTMVFKNIANRNNVPFALRKQGMLAIQDSIIYQLQGGIANINWHRVYLNNSPADSGLYTMSLAADSSYVDFRKKDTIFRMSVSGAGGGGGSGIIYPNLPNRALNGYGIFPELNTDSIAEGANNKFSQWINVTGGINYASNVGFNKALPTEKIDVVGNVNVSSGNAYKYNSVNIIRAQTALENVFFGNSGNLTMTGLRNTATGYNSLILNTTGVANTATGAVALGNNTSGFNNVANGHGALFNNTGGFNNVAVGHNALISNTTGFTNIAVGKDALQLNTTGYQNIAIGFQALQLNTNGLQNVAVGQDALKNNLTSNSNTAIGYQALYDISTGTGNNTAIGKLSGRWVTTGINNTFIGANIAFPSDTSISNNIAISSGDGIVKIRTTSIGVTSLFKGADVASASTIIPSGNVFHVTGTTGITGISVVDVYDGAEITIIFDGVLTVTDGSNLKLNGNLTTAADTVLKLVKDGSNYYEISRSPN